MESRVKAIHKLFILEVHHKGSVYNVTITSDLKTIYDVDVESGPGEDKENTTYLLDTIWECFLGDEGITNLNEI